jgi:hypothetical protein
MPACKRHTVPGHSNRLEPPLAAENKWIPAFAGMTIRERLGRTFRGNDDERKGPTGRTVAACSDQPSTRLLE